MLTRSIPPSKTRARSGGDAQRGFTLLELMVVMLLVGLMLLWLPARLDGFGDRSKLDSTASTIVSVLTGAREMAQIDGHEVRLQVELAPDVKDRTKTGPLPLRRREQVPRDARRAEGPRRPRPAQGRHAARRGGVDVHDLARAPRGRPLHRLQPGERLLGQEQPARRADRGLVLPRRRRAPPPRVAHHERGPLRGGRARHDDPGERADVDPRRRRGRRARVGASQEAGPQ